VRNDKTSDVQATTAKLQQQFVGAAHEIESLAFGHAGDFKSFEQQRVRVVWAQARVTIALFFAHRHERRGHPGAYGAGWTYVPIGPSAAAQSEHPLRGGAVWRTYLREVTQGERRGFYPLDEELGLTG